MKLHRLVLRNWRGVEEREVRFAETGVTVVEGPNETGKSSLVEALDALFTHLDDSKKREVLAIKPVHRDAGAEVEAEIESGPYRFTFFKRFHRGSETRLVVLRPTPENHTGREAHERALQILDETMDRALWSALRIEQGQEVTQANLADQKSLSAALDRAAGVARTGEAEQSLYLAAQAEYDRYFTSTGATRKETTAAEAEVKRLEDALALVRAELARLVADVERSAQLDRDVIEAERVVAESVTTQSLHDERLREVERLAGRVRETKAALDAATLAAAEAERRATDRTKLADEARIAAKASEDLASGDDLAAPAFKDARRELDEAEIAFAVATKTAQEVEHRAAIAQQDLDFRNDGLNLQLLGERKKRIEAADAAAAQAESVLSENALTDDVLKKLRAAHLDLEKARAALAAGSPELQIRARADLKPKIDGKARNLAAGDELTLPVAGSLSLNLPGVAEIVVRTGSSTADLRDAFDKKDRKFAEACRAVGVDDLDQAVLAHAKRVAAQGAVDARDRVLVDDLRDLTREQIAQKVSSLKRRVADYPASRAATFPIPSDFDAAQGVGRAVKAEVEVAKKARAAAERRRDAARHEEERLRGERTEAELGRERARIGAEMTAARLKEARLRESDEEVQKRAGAARDALRSAEDAHRAESDRLANAQPEAARLLADNALAARKHADERLRRIENERIEVRARLNERGEAGLAERADATDAELLQARDALARRRVHASAAKLLFETLDAERAESRKAYVAPLRQRIEQLGRIVYGPNFSVEVNDDLQIANRTLDGRTVPFESLSGGVKEQFGVISRLACALTVAEDGGVPVVFDDTLGNTDPTRIEAMCALLTLAGRKCQVIVLTCVPDRFHHVGAATIVPVA